MIEELETIAPSGKAPETRVKDATTAVAIFEDFRTSFSNASFNQAQIQAMIDGVPPYDDDEIIRAGRGGQCNINWGDADRDLEHAIASYVDLIQSPEMLVVGHTKFGQDVNERRELSEEIFSEISAMIRGWSGFLPAFLLNATHFVTHGVSFATHDNHYDWRFDCARMGEILLPQRTKASEDKIEILFHRKKYAVHEIYRAIQNEKAAKSMGWDIELTRKAILTAEKDNLHQGTIGDWERWQEDAKNNDLGTISKTRELNLVHMLVKEFDGKVSHFLFQELDNETQPKAAKYVQEGTQKGFLRRQLKRYDAMGQAITLFTFGVGSNGFIHSIRGQGFKTFPHYQTLNRLNSLQVDSAAMAGSVMFQPQDESDLRGVAVAYMGPYSFLKPGLKLIEKATPNLSQNVIPVVNQLREMARQRTAQYQPNNALPQGHELTRFEVSARLEQAASLSITQMILFYCQFDRLLKETVRRIMRYPASESAARELDGGAEVVEMRKRLEAKGIPLEALKEIDLQTVKADRAVGSGSSAARQVALRELTDLSPGFDETGRKRMIRDRVAAKLGSYEAADRYAPKPEMPREPVDTKIAVLENMAFESGQEVPVMPSELHLSHLKVHAAFIEQKVQMLEQGQAELTTIVQSVAVAHVHSTQHLEQVSGDPTASADIAYYQAATQRAGEIVLNGMRALEAEREAGGGEQGQGGQEDPAIAQQNMKLQMQVVEHQAKLEMLKEKHQVDMALKISEAETKRAIAEADAIAKLRPAKNL